MRSFAVPVKGAPQSLKGPVKYFLRSQSGNRASVRSKTDGFPLYRRPSGGARAVDSSGPRRDRARTSGIRVRLLHEGKFNACTFFIELALTQVPVVGDVNETVHPSHFLMSDELSHRPEHPLVINFQPASPDDGSSARAGVGGGRHGHARRAPAPPPDLCWWTKTGDRRASQGLYLEGGAVRYVVARDDVCGGTFDYVTRSFFERAIVLFKIVFLVSHIRCRSPHSLSLSAFPRKTPQGSTTRRWYARFSRGERSSPDKNYSEVLAGGGGSTIQSQKIIVDSEEWQKFASTRTPNRAARLFDSKLIIIPDERTTHRRHCTIKYQLYGSTVKIKNKYAER
ncbi:hypothetical protein EVAR_33212_1 [Eumeta japonica]|uniref:Uncharacterized protein n=1 Tax=Eumeta variegata TaxID=151549 RepID=A0A4C1W4U9_EUMVA|nr:hypothetical protein EVAR_33212_1 [Eumeta japonica]